MPDTGVVTESEVREPQPIGEIDVLWITAGLGCDGDTIAITAAYGLILGSFLTVVVDRVPRGASIVRPGSSCGKLICATTNGAPAFSRRRIC